MSTSALGLPIQGATLRQPEQVLVSKVAKIRSKRLPTQQLIKTVLQHEYYSSCRVFGALPFLSNVKLPNATTSPVQHLRVMPERGGSAQ